MLSGNWLDEVATLVIDAATLLPGPLIREKAGDTLPDVEAWHLAYPAILPPQVFSGADLSFCRSGASEERALSTADASAAR